MTLAFINISTYLYRWLRIPFVLYVDNRFTYCDEFYFDDKCITEHIFKDVTRWCIYFNKNLTHKKKSKHYRMFEEFNGKINKVKKTGRTKTKN